MSIDFRGEGRCPHSNRLVQLTAMLGLALAAGAESPHPVAADEGNRPAVSGPAVPAAPVVAPVVVPADASLQPAAPGDVEPGTPSPRSHRRLSPMAAELAQAIEAERDTLSELQARFDRAASEREALAIQHEIERLKTATEIALLRIQAKHARLKGRETVARRIDAAIEEILHPPVIRNPVVRPAPVEDGGGR